MEQTLIIVKPDGVQRGLMGEILARFERKGFRIVALKLARIDRATAERHYAVHKGKFFYESLVDYISSGPVLLAVIEGVSAISAVRLMIGSTRPYEAAPGTIRGDFAVTGLRNLVHASDGAQTAQDEIALYFKPEEILPVERDIDRWIFE